MKKMALLKSTKHHESQHGSSNPTNIRRDVRCKREVCWSLRDMGLPRPVTLSGSSCAAGRGETSPMKERPQSTPFLKRRDQQSAAGIEKGAKPFGLGASGVQSGCRVGR